MKGHIFGVMAMASMFGGDVRWDGMPRDFSDPYIPPSKPIPFTFKKFRRKEGEELPKGCKCERMRIVIIKPSSPIQYKITIECDIIYGTPKSGLKKIKQYQNEIGYFIYHTPIEKINQHKEDILIEEIVEEIKTESDNTK